MLLHVIALWPGNITLKPYHESIADYRRCYGITATKGELFVTIQLNPLPAYDCISAMDVSLNVSGVKDCSHYKMYGASDMYLIGNPATVTECLQTAEDPCAMYCYCEYRCEPSANLMFGWRGSSLAFRMEWQFAILDGTTKLANHEPCPLPRSKRIIRHMFELTKRIIRNNLEIYIPICKLENISLFVVIVRLLMTESNVYGANKDGPTTIGFRVPGK